MKPKLYPYPHDSQDDYPAAYDDNGAEIWHGERTVIYEGREIVLDTFRDEIIQLVKQSPLTLAAALGLEVTRYD